ncbi:hypothetical protein AB6A40_002680 [Gnathostoma spinigerum]|uniref:Bromodomain associated domain-containing protein n=1 Tax=Gnathostoma spinigerum TaxID=75299 RepID=A0ABD6EEY7_9BILA
MLEAMSDVEEYAQNYVRRSVALIIDNIGFKFCQRSVLDYITSITIQYLERIIVLTMDLTTHAGRTRPCMSDVNVAFCFLQIDMSDMHQYLKEVRGPLLPSKVPNFPVMTVSDRGCSNAVYISRHMEDFRKAIGGERQRKVRRYSGHFLADSTSYVNTRKRRLAPWSVPNFMGMSAHSLGMLRRRKSLYIFDEGDQRENHLEYGLIIPPRKAKSFRFENRKRKRRHRENAMVRAILKNLSSFDARNDMGRKQIGNSENTAALHVQPLSPTTFSPDINPTCKTLFKYVSEVNEGWKVCGHSPSGKDFERKSNLLGFEMPLGREIPSWIQRRRPMRSQFHNFQVRDELRLANFIKLNEISIKVPSLFFPKNSSEFNHNRASFQVSSDDHALNGKCRAHFISEDPSTDDECPEGGSGRDIFNLAEGSLSLNNENDEKAKNDSVIEQTGDRLQSLSVPPLEFSAENHPRLLIRINKALLAHSSKNRTPWKRKERRNRRLSLVEQNEVSTRCELKPKTDGGMVTVEGLHVRIRLPREDQKKVANYIEFDNVG